MPSGGWPLGEPAGLGLGTWVQAVPSQCKIRVRQAPVEPTAQALTREVAATPLSEAAGPAGLGTCLQAVPSQRKVLPAVQALRAEVAATPVRRPIDRAGLSFQAVPSQCWIRIRKVSSV
jgi:hypothetical protein